MEHTQLYLLINERFANWPEVPKSILKTGRISILIRTALSMLMEVLRAMRTQSPITHLMEACHEPKWGKSKSGVFPRPHDGGDGFEHKTLGFRGVSPAQAMITRKDFSPSDECGGPVNERLRVVSMHQTASQQMGNKNVKDAVNWNASVSEDVLRFAATSSYGSRLTAMKSDCIVYDFHVKDCRRLWSSAARIIARICKL